MRTKEFNKLIKTKDYDKIINDYIKCNIYLTDKQLTKVVELRKKDNFVIAFKYKKVSDN